MGAITTHVLDTSRGRPAVGVPVVLAVRAAGNDWVTIGKGKTDQDGRLATLVPGGTPLQEGIYRLTFDAGTYFRALGVESIYSEVPIVFAVRDATEGYHIPLLLSANGYTTYRGS